MEMCDQEYDKKNGTVREFKRINKLGRFAPQTAIVNDYKNEADKIKLYSRCLVEKDGLQKRGEVMYVGTTTFKPGFWVGVKYDEPVGKHDG